MSIRNEILEEILIATESAGGGVQSVTGDSVDNTDQQNPIVNAPTVAPADTTYALKGDDWMPIYESSVGFRLKWSSDLINPPGINEISGNNVDLALITKLFINKTVSNSADISFLLSKLRVNNTLYGFVDQNSNSFAGYAMTGDSVDRGTYFELPVVAGTAGTNPGDGDFLLLGIIATDVQSGHYLGVYADLNALQTAHPTGRTGDTATVTAPDGNLFYWDGGAWADSGTGFMGDMLKSVYDPTNKSADSFSMGNMTETAAAKVLTQPERDKIAASVTTTQHRETYGYDIHIDDTVKATAYSISNGVKTAIQNNAASEIFDLPPSVPHLIGPSGGALLDQVNAIYSIGIQFSAEPATRDKDYYILFEIPDGVSPGVNLQISKRFQRFAKNIQEETISMSFTIPCTTATVNKEIIAYIETDGTDLDYWGTQLTVTKINGPIS